MRKYLIAMLLFATSAQAHSWYPWQCCSGDGENGDCHPVPCIELEEQKDGGYTYHKFSFRKSQVMPSQDRKCHVCISGETKGFVSPHCVFILQGS